ncbi:MAG: D-alanine--D-alanine ligase [Cytophagales bacterium]|nr:D-alanine--D-alanine ligase [Cytophagales bacterium]
MREKPSVAVLYGGRSVEHEISIRSAKNVAANIDPEKFGVILIGIDKNGSWYLNGSISDPVDSGVPISIKLDAMNPKLIEEGSNNLINIDVVFPMLHGTDGEDGSIQGLFKAMNLPVAGSGVLGSAISMDKIVSKKILQACGIPVASYTEYQKDQMDTISFDAIANQLGTPFMIKSAALGSSVGISMVKSGDQFDAALKDSFRYSEKIMIEEFIEGRELECAILGNEHPKASLPGEIVIQKDYDFYTYEAKYLDDKAIRIDLPAHVDDRITERIRKISVEAYKALRCEDYARVDLFLKEDGAVVVNEINTIPGFTNVSMFPMMWQHMGMSYTELVSEIINLSIERFNKSKDLETDYYSSN